MLAPVSLFEIQNQQEIFSLQLEPWPAETGTVIDAAHTD
jgi:hypothetical protein